MRKSIIRPSSPSLKKYSSINAIKNMLKKNAVLGSVFLLVLGIIVFTYLYIHSHQIINPKDSSMSEKLVATDPVSRNIEFSSSASLDKTSDSNNNNKLDSGESMIFTYKITNPTTLTTRFLNLDTGVDTKIFYERYDLKGITGLDDSGDKIILRNIVLSPNALTEISFKGRAIITNEDIQITANPMLITNDKQITAKGKQISFILNKGKDIKVPINGITGVRQ